MAFFSLKTDPIDIETSRNELFSAYTNGYNAWDPSGKSPDVEKLKEINSQIHAKYLYLKKNPKYLKKSLFIVLIISVLVSLIFFFFQIYIMGILIIIFPVLIFYGILRNLGKDLIKLEIANENNWLYMPDKDSYLWSMYRNKFPEIFNKGEKYQSLEDIFWGAIKNGENWNYFVSGLFNYTTTSTDSKGRRQDHNHISNFFAIKLPKTLNSRFYLYPENVFSKIGNFFTKKEINTESIRFNETFAFSYNGEKGEKALEIVKTLSPRVQEELLKFNEEKKKSKRFSIGLSVLFTEDTVIFYSSGPFISKMKTDFLFKSQEINPKDKEYVSNQINSAIKISCDMMKYLD